MFMWTASSEIGTYRLCEQRRFRRPCATAQSRQNLRCSLIQAVSQEKPSDRKPDPWPLWMAGHAQLKFVMTECSKTQIRLTGLMLYYQCAPTSTQDVDTPIYPGLLLGDGKDNDCDGKVDEELLNGIGESRHDKTNKWPCVQRRLRSARASSAQSQSIRSMRS